MSIEGGKITELSKKRNNILLLSYHPKIGARTIHRLLALGLLDDIFNLKRSDLYQSGVPDKIIEAILEIKNKFNLEDILSKLDKSNIAFITRLDKVYPTLLNEIPDPPEILFYKGSLEIINNLAVSIVGSRKSSTYGANVTQDIVSQLVKAGLTVTSGLALGIDGLAHQATLANGGKTIAVLGNGLDTIYPASHWNLARQILESGGLILSEYPPETPSFPSNFPMRNRIIAGLSKATVIIEAGQKSGSLLTARACLDYNREVLAIPHNWYSPGGEGPNRLIKMGATIITSPEDILDILNIKATSKKVVLKAGSKDQEIILSLLSNESLHIDTIIDRSKLAVSIVGSTLTLMEMKGLVKHIGGNNYVRGF